MRRLTETLFGERTLFEHTWLEKLVHSAPKSARCTIIDRVRSQGKAWPIWSIEIGPSSPETPTFMLTAGVHGLERIGTHVALSWLESVWQRYHWDKDLVNLFNSVRLCVVPLVNPIGMLQSTRCNGNGIDLMRNAPHDADGDVPFLLGGHRISPRLPWYRGEPSTKMETEAQALCDYAAKSLYESRFAFSLDLHSGFGSVDRLWTPYARTTDMFPDWPLARELSLLLDATYPNHVYEIEQQSQSYTSNGDLWDHIYDHHPRVRQAASQTAGSNCYVPWTLEMGSWAWVRKNPRQLLTSYGAFNPMQPHRHARIMRRHVVLLEFLLRAVRSHRRWHKG